MQWFFTYFDFAEIRIPIDIHMNWFIYANMEAAFGYQNIFKRHSPNIFFT